MPRISACGGRRNAYDSFKTALRVGERTPILLVDSEDSLTAASAWEHLRKRPQDNWPRPLGASNDHCHLMVQVMESWFLADGSGLASFFGHGFHVGGLPGNPNVEEIGKADVLQGLERATRHAKNGPYEKGRLSFRVLGEINPSVVESAAPSVKRLLDVLRGGGPSHG